MKKVFSFFMVFMFLFNFKPIIANATQEIPELECEGAALIDATTGTLLYGKNEHKQLAPASTTKIMTALLILENKKLDEKVTIGKNPTFAEGTRVGLKEGEIYTINDLLHGLLLESANDCAVALAESVSGSEKSFAELMNKRAKELGALDTNFVNASGLYEEGHVTTAYDLSLIMKTVVKNDTFVKISRKPLYQFPPSNIDNSIKWVNNKNELILNTPHFYKYAVSGKTGYTTLSKHTYTSAAEKNGQLLVLSILRSDSKKDYFPEAKKLFDYGFDNFDLIKLYSKGNEIASCEAAKTKVPLICTKDIYYVTKKSDFKPNETLEEKIKDLKACVSLEQKDLSKASFKKGDNILSANINVNNKQISTIPLSSGVDVTYTEPSKLSTPQGKLLLGLGIAMISLSAFATLYKIKKLKAKKKLEEDK
ncbi:D-alanyl-D-alanine carboxypeptidase [Clostridium cavendishii DSM 21758]|uniref:serine-type D-Ala-D-Ala carboxypeptidase n=1 Tax=Clostridium cavendishii DSM 21758 TaxID=1121302 RepID=A0A1M6BHC8_9CLOT|nr:D-alanyl-D-alanine carboxypeptidase family protein [Clostridium cavendishii]SHI48121.1 D-alanyl-D-alanine carboxypeptidase [Clostridium cavendishii DSM 21758]